MRSRFALIAFVPLEGPAENSERHRIGIYFSYSEWESFRFFFPCGTFALLALPCLCAHCLMPLGGDGAASLFVSSSKGIALVA
jgi:hypothetical protein